MKSFTVKVFFCLASDFGSDNQSVKKYHNDAKNLEISGKKLNIPGIVLQIKIIICGFYTGIEK